MRLPEFAAALNDSQPDPFHIAYADMPVDATDSSSIDSLVQAWADNYRSQWDQNADLSIVDAGTAAVYLFDHADTMGGPPCTRQARVVAAWGTSKAPDAPRDMSRMRGFPKPRPGDQKGHLFAHASGGGLDINLVPMAAHLNLHQSQEGKVFHKMERFAWTHPGTFYFIRPIYVDDSDRPAFFDVGVKMPERLWVERFRN